MEKERKEGGGDRVATIKTRGREEMEKEARREGGGGEGMNLITVTKINDRGVTEKGEAVIHPLLWDVKLCAKVFKGQKHR